MVKSQHNKNLPYGVKNVSYNVNRVPNTDIWYCDCIDFHYKLTRKHDKYCKHIISCIILKDTILQQNKIEPTSQPKICPRCYHTTIRKNGFRIIRNNIRRQKYSCKQCQYQFIQNENSLGNVHSDPKIISESLNLVMNGMSYRATARHIKISHGIEISHVSVLNWIQKFTYIIKGYVELFYPELGNVWCVDEMNLRIKDTEPVKNKGLSSWLWSIIDPQTKFLIATNISKKQTIKNAKKILSFGKNQVMEIPDYIITDSLAGYEEAIRHEFKNRVAHIKTKSFRDGFVNLPIERYHNEIRVVLNARRSLGNDESAQTFAELLKIHHNFVKKHMGLNDKTSSKSRD